jgi:hypothetical protein
MGCYNNNALICYILVLRLNMLPGVNNDNHHSNCDCGYLS